MAIRILRIVKEESKSLAGTRSGKGHFGAASAFNTFLQLPKATPVLTVAR